MPSSDSEVEREKTPVGAARIFKRSDLLPLAVIAIIAIILSIMVANRHPKMRPNAVHTNKQTTNTEAVADDRGRVNPAPAEERAQPLTLQFVRADSEEPSAERGYGENAVDGNPDPSLPHEIIIELVPPSTIKGFTYLPRQDESDHGIIRDFEFYVSNDGKNFGEPVTKGAFKSGREKKIEMFKPIRCRFIKLRALSEINGLAWSSAAEIGVIQDGQDVSSKDGH